MATITVDEAVMKVEVRLQSQSSVEEDIETILDSWYVKFSCDIYVIKGDCLMLNEQKVFH